MGRLGDEKQSPAAGCDLSQHLLNVSSRSVQRSKLGQRIEGLIRFDGNANFGVITHTLERLYEAERVFSGVVFGNDCARHGGYCNASACSPRITKTSSTADATSAPPKMTNCRVLWKIAAPVANMIE